MRPAFLPFFMLSFSVANGQPFIDLVNLHYTSSPDAGILRRDQQHNRFYYLNINLNLPVLLKKDSGALVFSPFAEQWNLRMDNVTYLPDHLQSFALAVAYIKPISTKWSMAFNLIPRWNGYNGNWFDNNFQLGGAILGIYKKSRQLKYKFGIYYNSELSGAFFMPLLGLDWKVDSKNNIFGVLPGNMVWEHKAGKNFSYGAVFRAVTNSYKAGTLNSKDYFVRIDDNQLSVYSDIYITRRIAFNIEAGHSVLRQVRLGYKNGIGNFFYKEKTNDDFLFNAGLAYRIRL